MRFSNEPIDFMDILRLLLPVITFAMGYLLTGVAHKRALKRDILRERFEKLYHPFYIMINELGTESAEGFAFSVGDGTVIKSFFDHLTRNIYLASTEGQALFWQTRSLFYRCVTNENPLSPESEHAIDEALGALFSHLLMAYLRCANALGYNLGDANVGMEVAAVRVVD